MATISIQANAVRPLLITDWMIPPFVRDHFHGKTKYIPGKQVLVRSWLWKKNTQKKIQEKLRAYCSNVCIYISGTPSYPTPILWELMSRSKIPWREANIKEKSFPSTSFLSKHTMEQIYLFLWSQFLHVNLQFHKILMFYLLVTEDFV